MKEKEAKRIDKLLGDLGLSPKHVNPEGFSGVEAPFIPAPYNPVTGLCGKTCYTSEAAARKSAKRIMQRGANTSFFRPYFCNECHAWHLTSSRNLDASTAPTRNASHKRRKHQPPDSAHET